MIRFKCQHCGKAIAVKDEGAGKKGKCPGCGQTVQVPKAAVQEGPEPGETPKPPVRSLTEPKQEIVDPPQLPSHPEAPFMTGYPPQRVAATPAPVAVQVNVNQSRAAHSLGIASLVLGILSFFVCWLPFVGLGFGGLGLVLGIAGLVLAIVRKGSGIGYSIAGTAVSSVAVVIGIGFMIFVWGMVSPIEDFSGPNANEEELKKKQMRGLREDLAEVFGTKHLLEKEDWCKRHGISDEEYDGLLENWQNRTGYDGFSPREAFWEVAHNFTPKELRKQFPPLTAKELFKARLPTSTFSWRDFDRPISFGDEKPPYTLSILVGIRTMPDEPITRLQGLLKIHGPRGEELHSEIIDHQPDVSFTDHTFYRCEWEYDDANPKHRTLRHSDDLTVSFDVRHVTFADGRRREF